MALATAGLLGVRCQENNNQIEGYNVPPDKPPTLKARYIYPYTKRNACVCTSLLMTLS